MTGAGPPPETGLTYGAYPNDGEPARPSRQARDHTAQDALHEATHLPQPWH
ncbi:hypothetical protein [Streptosporangium sp. NPDC001681]|uniref:hypothetical protein n=1 Tax=Streptosporangium sp. NPDC001681 TaxID=3154395 RepID=UPI003330B57E